MKLEYDAHHRYLGLGPQNPKEIWVLAKSRYLGQLNKPKVAI